MKIGILSMQRVINYGSFLQAYALRELVIKVTNEKNITFVDIEDGITLDINKGIPLYIRKIKGLIKTLIKGLFFEKMRDIHYLKLLEQQFKKEFFPILDIRNESLSENTEFDFVVIGSDEVFHCCQNAKWGFSTQLLGDIKNANKVFSYAASFGTTTYQQIKKYGIEQKVILSLSKLSNISVRDNNSKKNIECLLNIEPSVNLDPVLLYDFSELVENSNDFFTEQDYLVVYSYTGRITNKNEIKFIKEFAREKKLKIYTIFCRYKWSDDVIMPESPFQLLKIFKKSKYVISDTFHGSIFSIITHSKFCTLIRNSNKEKMESMLSMLKLSDRAVYNPENIKTILETDINYSVVDNIRENEYQKTIKYLTNCFKDEV